MIVLEFLRIFKEQLTEALIDDWIFYFNPEWASYLAVIIAAT